MKYKFTLSHDTVGDLEISEPGGWKDTVLKLDRDPTFDSLVEHLEGDAEGGFIFYGDNGDVNGGIDFLREVEQLDGFDAKLDALLELSFDDINYEEFFSGQVNIASFFELPTNKIQAGITRNDLWAKFINRYDTPVNLLSDTDLDGNPVEDVFSHINVNLTSQTIRKRYESAMESSFAFGATGGNNIQFDWDKSEINELEGKFSLPRSSNSALPSSIFIAPNNGVYSFDIKAYFTRPQVTGDGSIGFPFVFSWENLSGWLNVYFKKNEETPIAFTRADLGGVNKYSQYTYSTTITLNEGDSIRVYGDALQSFDALGPGSELVLIGEDPAESGENFWVQTFPVSGLQSHFRILADTVFPDSQADGFLAHDVAAAVIQRMGLGNVFYSEILGSTRTKARQYEEDGCFWAFALVKGLQVRGYGIEDKPFFISFKQFWEGMNPIFCLGLGYEEIEGEEVIRLEERAHFYGSTASINFSNVHNISRSYDNSRIFKTVKTGFKKWQSEDIAGIDDPQTKHTYATRFERMGVDITLESDFIAASLAIETTRRKKIKESTDYKFDNDVFIIALNPSPADEDPDTSPEVDDYGPEFDENFNSVSGLLNSDTRYNLTLTPLRNLLRWANFLNGCLQSYTTSSYKFVSGEGNYDMVSDYDCASGQQCIGVICDPLSEGEDLSLGPPGNYATPLGYIHLPMLYDISIPMEAEEYLTVRNNRKNPIGISQTDSDHQLFHIKTASYEPINGTGVFKAWPKEFFPITVIDSTPETQTCV